MKGAPSHTLSTSPFLALGEAALPALPGSLLRGFSESSAGAEGTFFRGGGAAALAAAALAAAGCSLLRGFTVPSWAPAAAAGCPPLAAWGLLLERGEGDRGLLLAPSLPSPLGCRASMSRLGRACPPAAAAAAAEPALLPLEEEEEEACRAAPGQLGAVPAGWSACSHAPLLCCSCCLCWRSACSCCLCCRAASCLLRPALFLSAKASRAQQLSRAPNATAMPPMEKLERAEEEEEEEEEEEPRGSAASRLGRRPGVEEGEGPEEEPPAPLPGKGGGAAALALPGRAAGVALGLAPVLREAVALEVAEAVGELVPLLLPVALPVQLGLLLPLLLTVEEALEVMEGLAPVLRVAVGLELALALRD
jgi:hypothetical protein